MKNIIEPRIIIGIIALIAIFLLVICTAKCSAQYVKEPNNSLTLTLSNPGLSVPGLQYSRMFKYWNIAVASEYWPNKIGRITVLAGGPIEDHKSWFDVGFAYSQFGGYRKLTYEFGFTVFVQKIALSLNSDIELGYARIGIGRNF
jgi:hypothetical protein